MATTNLRLAGLFAGVGGIELGFHKAGFDPIFANEIDKKASITYRLNHSHELVTKDINLLDSKEILEFLQKK
jgi:DNA (cytosine-5)-methyltransferase 1